MSTLGRKAMRKTLKRLKKIAKRQIDKYIEIRDKIIGKHVSETVLVTVTRGDKTIASLIDYVKALEDYSLELDEAWDELLKSIKETQQGKPKPIQKKEEGKKTTYIK